MWQSEPLYGPTANLPGEQEQALLEGGAKICAKGRAETRSWSWDKTGYGWVDC